MRYLILLALVVSFIGCASLKSKVVKNNIQVGDPLSKLTDVMGEPDAIKPSTKIEGATAWYYHKGSESCGFTIKDSTIARVQCKELQKKSSSFWSGLGAGFVGASQGMNEYHQQHPYQTNPQPVTCNTSTYGNQSYTTCE